MAILSYQLSDAVGLNPDGSQAQRFTATVNYDSTLLVLTTVHIVNQTPTQRVLSLGAFTITAPANSDASYASPNVLLAMSAVRGLLRPPSHAT